MTAQKGEAMSDELKPCPFCGGPCVERQYEAYSLDSSFYSIGCAACDLYFLGAPKTWNTRADSAEAEPDITLMSLQASVMRGVTAERNKAHAEIQRLKVELEAAKARSLGLDESFNNINELWKAEVHAHSVLQSDCAAQALALKEARGILKQSSVALSQKVPVEIMKMAHSRIAAFLSTPPSVYGDKVKALEEVAKCFAAYEDVGTDAWHRVSEARARLDSLKA